MAKPHKYAWNGIDVETVLTIEQLANMAQRSAMECTGDIVHGKHRIAVVKSTDRQIEFRVNDFLITFKKFMVFYLDFERRGDRTWMSSRIAWYVTTQPTVGGFIPVAAKSMVGHFTYMQFVRHLAAQVKAADTQARVTIREGLASTASAETRQADEASPQQSSAPLAAAIRPASAPVVGQPPPPLGRTVPPPPPPSARPASEQPAPLPTPIVAPPGRPGFARSVGESAPAPAAPVVDAVSSVKAGGTPVRRGSVASAEGLVTSVPGMPARARATSGGDEIRSGGLYSSVAEQMFAEDDDLYETRLTQAGGEALPWVLEHPDGVVIPLSGPVVLGRNPTPPPSAPEASRLPLNDPNRSVSKTHALLELREGLPWITDLNSTNGTTLANDIGEATLCVPGDAIPVGDGWQLGLGEYTVRLVRRRS